MRNLIFLIERFHLIIVFLVLEGTAFFFIRKHNLYHDSVIGNHSVAVSGRMYAARNNVVSFFNLKSENERLTRENTEILALVGEQQHFIPDSTLPDYSDVYTFTYIPAKIIDNSLTETVNHLILDKGASDGVRKNYGVITFGGVIGMITHITEHYSKVMSVVSTKSRISVKHNKSNAFGNLIWNGNDPWKMTIENVNKTNPVEVGDTFSTTGYSNFFPPDIPAAVVTEVTKDPSGSFLNIEAVLSVEVDKIGYVYIVQGKDREVLDSLKMISN